jgi:hypothetical protein
MTSSAITHLVSKEEAAYNKAQEIATADMNNDNLLDMHAARKAAYMNDLETQNKVIDVCNTIKRALYSAIVATGDSAAIFMFKDCKLTEHLDKYYRNDNSKDELIVMVEEQLKKEGFLVSTYTDFSTDSRYIRIMLRGLTDKE